MSVSEARRQIETALSIAGSDNTALSGVVAHGFSALVEVIAAGYPADGDLNAYRIPVTAIRALSVDAVKAGVEDIGLEDLIRSLRARSKNASLDE